MQGMYFLDNKPLNIKRRLLTIDQRVFMLILVNNKLHNLTESIFLLREVEGTAL